MIIYKATNIKRGKSYIGQTIYDLNFRIKSHLTESKYDNLPFHNALLKYPKYFTWEIIENCNNKNELDEMEFHYIKQYNTLSPNGYNLTLGGEGNYGWTPTKDQKKNISIALKKWWNNQDREYRKKHGKRMRIINTGRDGWSKGLTKETDKRIMKISNGNKNKRLTEETKQKIRNSSRNRKHTEKSKQKMRKNQLGENNSFYGKTHTKETLEKKSKNLYEITYPNGYKEIVKVFSIWCRENKINEYKLWYASSKGKFFKRYFVKKIK